MKHHEAMNTIPHSASICLRQFAAQRVNLPKLRVGQAQFIKIRLFALAPPKNRALLSMQILLKIAMSSANY